MTKYLRCHTAGVAGQKVGERYEVIHEDDRVYTIRGSWSYTKLPDSGGDSYRNWFTLEPDDKPIGGRKAEVIHPGRRWTSYHALSARLGYPDAARDVDKDSRTRPREDDVVTILSATDLAGNAVIHDGERVYVVESENGDRHTFSEKGLRILSDNITVLPDESLNGIEREYREVKREAAVGERIKITAGRDAFFGQDFHGTIHEATDVAGFNVKTTGKWKDGTVLNPAHDDYVVLESTDIARIGEERFRMVNRKAAVGDRVIIVSSDKTESAYCYFRHTIGETGDVDSRLSDRAGVNGWYILDGDYRVLEPLTAAPLLSVQSAQDQAAATISALALRLAALEATVRHMDTDIRVAQEDIDIMDEGIAYDVRKLEAEVAALKGAATTYLKTQPATAAEVSESKAARQQRRDEIVERARADVADLRKFRGTPILNDTVCFWPLTEQTKDYVPMHTVEHVVNRDKRTVVAIIRCTCDGHITRGVAKCAPGDVFNAHIGRVISLRRALGLDVPAEYLNVPQPTEVRVGDVVEGTSHSGATGPVQEIGHNGEENFVIYRNDTNRRCFDRCWSGVTRVIILDDTREEVAA
ncbi:hypothetical protein ACIFQM_11240 [Paenibacillus sp. NRS-1782]|uniref:hypothetical protein n=1 Tax=unclassified Paenibacillus TaxID=185978 RepID=UPI003D2B7CEB